VQLKRLIERDGLSESEARQRIAAQMPQEEKCKFADYLIDTSEGFEATRARTAQVFSQLQELID
jgi:dephospho-CoA kinase